MPFNALSEKFKTSEHYGIEKQCADTHRSRIPKVDPGGSSEEFPHGVEGINREERRGCCQFSVRFSVGVRAFRIVVGNDPGEETRFAPDMRKTRFRKMILQNNLKKKEETTHDETGGGRSTRLSLLLISYQDDGMILREENGSEPPKELISTPGLSRRKEGVTGEAPRTWIGLRAFIFDQMDEEERFCAHFRFVEEKR
ncbi:hypothetical protein NPIL_685711 [Nephila pilipes]|uniref:Uncharacterized protein n=1 Tax=Nephila pilipes TaxID=299642 RepID=A0A8X6PG46_NEPPI|nr:hypothetical protein NPIL_685711 [Nephila pilipes]